MIAVRGKPGDAPTSDEELRFLDELHGPTGRETPMGARLGATLVRASSQLPIAPEEESSDESQDPSGRE